MSHVWAKSRLKTVTLLTQAHSLQKTRPNLPKMRQSAVHVDYCVKTSKGMIFIPSLIPPAVFRFTFIGNYFFARLLEHTPTENQPPS